MIEQGQIYWIDLGDPSGSAPSYRRPCLVVQNDLFNASRIGTTVVCALTSNLKWASAPGNLLLSAGEAGLPAQTVVNVSQLRTVDKNDLGELIGRISAVRLQQVLDGLHLLFDRMRQS